MPSQSTPTVPDTVARLTELALKTYAGDPARVEEDANGERRIHQGGYGDRQLFELIQNAADELRDERFRGGRVKAVLTTTHLYCANEGTPLTPEGAETILRMGVSRKRGGQIGRFGVGVKSVLSVSRTPQFFSTTGAFGFDADWSAHEIVAAVEKASAEAGVAPPQLDDTPVLRLARPLDVERECKADEILHELLQWATTVVRLPLIDGAADSLALSMHREVMGAGGPEEFPTLFQLFSPHVGTIALEDRRGLPIHRRELRVSSDGSRTIVHHTRNGQRARDDRFRVFSVAHSVPDEVRAESGELHDRATLDVSWSVPEYRVDESGADPLWHAPADRGVFWSYFPTKYPMTLSGGLNAAWKTNEDRQNLLDNAELNRELIDVAARLVIDSLPDLVVPEDPAAYLALLPGRAKESPNWACKLLTTTIWEMAASSPSLPDQDGRLQPPRSLHIPPDKVSHPTLKLWAEYTGRPKNWVHHSVDALKLRHGKMNHILEAVPGKAPESIGTWLEALVGDESVEASKSALKVLDRLIHTDLAGSLALIAEAKSARVLLTSEGKLVAPTAGQVYRRTSDDGLNDDLVYVHDSIADDPEMAHVLGNLGIRDADSDGRFKSILDQGFAGYTDVEWTRFWELLRSAGGPAQYRTIAGKFGDPATVIQVKTVSGDFAPIRACLRPGPVVPDDGSRDEKVAVDIGFHADDQSILRSLGLRDRPEIGVSYSEDDSWFQDYREAMYKKYCDELGPTQRRVLITTLRLEGGDFAGPLRIFRRLSEEGRAKFIANTPPEGLVANWTQQVGKQSNTRTRVPSPIRWLYSEHGHLDTSLGVRPVAEAVSPALKNYENVLPVAKISLPLAQRLDLRADVKQIQPAEWTALLQRLRTSEDDAFIGRTYPLLIRVALDLLLEEPSVRCRVGDTWELRPDNEVVVTTERSEFDDLVRQAQPTILIADPGDSEFAEYMHVEWGMLRYSDVVEKEVRVVPAGAAAPLADALPAFRTRPGLQQIRNFTIQECRELDEITRTPGGEVSRPLAAHVDGDNVLIPTGLNLLEQMELVDKSLSFGFGRGGCVKIRELHDQFLRNEKRRERLTKIREAQLIPDKLALMFSKSALQSGLPTGLVESEMLDSTKPLPVLRIAELAFNAYDEGVLKHYAKEIASDLGDVPSRFDGGHRALKFVTDLGFPDSFAGSSTPAPPQREEARGPVKYPALHSYQEKVASRFVDFLSEPLPGRAMLSLPTGAGKTRVAAEAVIRWVRDNGVPDGPILWIAQTTELCEQAVQSWKFVWEQVGPPENLVLDRLWTNNSATPVTGRPQLVVATDAKLASCLDTDDYEWLRNASLVIVDEAHVATSKEYTGIFEQLGLTRSKTRRNLVGLTATPFRNSEQLTHRLAGRFGNLRLDHGVLGDNPIARLQELKVLSKVQHRELEGASIRLTDYERSKAAEMNGVLPKSVEIRLAADEVRNRELLSAIEKMPADWPVLVFATSVDHAKIIAAKLNGKGIRAAAIDAGTSSNDRRRSIEEFRNGKIRVITNYGVLSQGFDAPATRAVVIARPVYSANIYQQMVGRGLRGVENGGKEECLILDVKDNITNFENQLAFNEFEYLWDGDS